MQRRQGENPMNVQMYIIALKGTVTDDTSREIQRFVRKCGGLILMVTQTGPLVALSEEQAAAVSKHALVGFIGPVHLNPRGMAAGHLQQIFAENLAKQLIIEDRGDAEPAP
jgi:hypothetical protein